MQLGTPYCEVCGEIEFKPREILTPQRRNALGIERERQSSSKIAPRCGQVPFFRRMAEPGMASIMKEALSSGKHECQRKNNATGFA